MNQETKYKTKITRLTNQIIQQQADIILLTKRYQFIKDKNKHLENQLYKYTGNKHKYAKFEKQRTPSRSIKKKQK